MITVVNKKTHTPTENDVFIGRGSPLGNPYTSIPATVQTKAEYHCDSREQSLKMFSEYLNEKIKNKDTIVCKELNSIWKKVRSGTNMNLVCYCMPQPCHGTIIKKIIESKLDIHRTYKGKILSLKENQIAIVGTNTQGRYGKGFALLCKEKFGAKNGKPRGLNGQCFGIVTKDLTKDTHPSRTPEQIKEEIKSAYEFADNNKHLELLCPYNCHDNNLNYYSSEELALFFAAFRIPLNVVFEEQFYKLIKKYYEF